MKRKLRKERPLATFIAGDSGWFYDKDHRTFFCRTDGWRRLRSHFKLPKKFQWSRVTAWLYKGYGRVPFKTRMLKHRSYPEPFPALIRKGGRPLDVPDMDDILKRYIGQTIYLKVEYQELPK